MRGLFRSCIPLTPVLFWSQCFGHIVADFCSAFMYLWETLCVLHCFGISWSTHQQRTKEMKAYIFLSWALVTLKPKRPASQLLKIPPIIHLWGLWQNIEYIVLYLKSFFSHSTILVSSSLTANAWNTEDWKNHRSGESSGHCSGDTTEIRSLEEKSVMMRTSNGNHKVKDHHSTKQICLCVYLYTAMEADLALRCETSHSLVWDE